MRKSLDRLFTKFDAGLVALANYTESLERIEHDGKFVEQTEKDRLKSLRDRVYNALWRQGFAKGFSKVFSLHFSYSLLQVVPLPLHAFLFAFASCLSPLTSCLSTLTTCLSRLTSCLSTLTSCLSTLTSCLSTLTSFNRGKRSKIFKLTGVNARKAFKRQFHRGKRAKIF